MAELPHRDQLEADFAKKFGKVARRHMHEFRAHLGRPADINNVPEEFWKMIEKEAEQSSYLLLFAIFTAAAAYHGWQNKDSRLAAFGWALLQAQAFGMQWAESTRDRLEKGIAKILNEADQGIPIDRVIDRVIDDRIAPPGVPMPVPVQQSKEVTDAIDDLLEKTFGPSRIEREVIIETTTARSAGAENAMEVEGEISEMDIWCNPNDESTCGVCEPLIGTTRSVWIQAAPNGPPPTESKCRCRCGISYEADRLRDGVTDIGGWGKTEWARYWRNPEKRRRDGDQKKSWLKSWDESKHPRGHEGNAGQFSSVESSGRSHAEEAVLLNRKWDEVERITGLNLNDHWDIYESTNSGSFNENMQAMDKLIERHKDKVKPWEPENPYEMSKFETGDWETPEKRKARRENWVAFNAARKKFSDFISQTGSDLSGETKKAYLTSVQTVLQFMPTKAIKALTENVKHAEFYANLKSLGKAVVDPGEQINGTVGGAWEGHSSGKGILHLDGDNHTMQQRGIYAHEFGHACDYTEGTIKETVTEGGSTFSGQRAGRISDTGEWRHAYLVELSKGQLSRYGATEPCEGFAEFARLCWGTGQRRKDIAEEYPLSYAVFRKHGLIP